MPTSQPSQCLCEDSQKKNQKFIWGKEQQEAFQTLKQKLTCAEVMCYYNPITETNLIVDAGPKGLGAMLSQKQKYRQFKPILHSSRALTDVESRYSQTEKEALAITWAFQHYHYYICDRHVIVYTDHKPLERLLTTSSTTPPRIQRWLMRLHAYKYTIKYRPGIENAADILSRSPELQASTENPGE